jgi:hypothetical protein
MLRFIFTLAFLTTFTGLAHAGDEGLYPSAPPPGSAFVRFLNAGGNTGATAIEVHGKAYGAATLAKTTPYVPAPHGTVPIKFGSAALSPDLKEGAHYTVVLRKGAATLLEEPSDDNPLKAEIIVINASSAEGVSLKTADGHTNVVEPVATGKLGGRAVNAVKAAFAIYSGEKKVSDLEARSLERGARYAVVVYDGEDGKPAASFN